MTASWIASLALAMTAMSVTLAARHVGSSSKLQPKRAAKRRFTHIHHNGLGHHPKHWL